MANVEKTPETIVVNKTVEATDDHDADKVNEDGKVNVKLIIDAYEVKANESKAEVTNVKQEEATKNTAEAVGEEKKEEEAPPKVILHQFPPGKYIPNASPFCLKLETFLRIHKIPYENQYGSKMGKNGKVPWIEYKGEAKADSNLIINYLNDKFEVDLDKKFTSKQMALGRATRVSLEENTYWALVYNRYIENFDEFKKCIAPPGIGLGFSISQKLYQGKMRTNLDGHGLGRHTKEELYSVAEQDLKAVSDLLGEKPYLLGDAVSSFDCAVFGLCANMLYSGLESPMSTYIKEHATNISTFCERIKGIYWKDWADLVGEKGCSSGENESKTPAEKEPEKEKVDDTPVKGAPAEDAAPASSIPVEKNEVDGNVPSSEAITETLDQEKCELGKENKTESETVAKIEAPAEILFIKKD